MNDEIKEILDKLSNRKQETLLQALRDCQLKNIEHPFITREEYIDKILDYITNLQNEIFDLKDTIQNKNDCIGAYECIIEDRDKRIDKAIKYCEESSKTIKSEYFSDVLNILIEK